jgi:hypothetical protein
MKTASLRRLRRRVGAVAELICAYGARTGLLPLVEERRCCPGLAALVWHELMRLARRVGEWLVQLRGETQPVP